MPRMIKLLPKIRVLRIGSTEPLGSAGREASQSPPSLAIAVFPIAIPTLVTAPGIAAIAAIGVLNRHDFAHQAVVGALLLAVMALNLLILWNTEAILKRSAAGGAPPACSNR
jgi:small neutral amino acid transporter SnatA (MarC family)